jgi:hypothetical protein
MLTLRNDQIHAFQDSRRAEVEAWMLEHLRTHLSAAVGERGDAELLRLIRSGIARARLYGAVSQAAACLMVDIMAVLGEGFDTDPAYPWVPLILRDESLGSPAARIKQLSLAVLRHLSEQSGQESSP